MDEWIDITQWNKIDEIFAWNSLMANRRSQWKALIHLKEAVGDLHACQLIVTNDTFTRQDLYSWREDSSFFVQVTYVPGRFVETDLISCYSQLSTFRCSGCDVEIVVLVGVGVVICHEKRVLYVPELVSAPSSVDSFFRKLFYALSGASRSVFISRLPALARDYVCNSSLPSLGSFREQDLSSRFKRIGTGGCFDLVHDGHRALLQICRRMSDELVLFINTDRSVRALKGPGRPYMKYKERLAVLTDLMRPSDSIVPFSVRTAPRFLSAMQVDIFIKGTDYWMRSIPEAMRAKPPVPVLIVDSVIEMHTSELMRSSDYP